MKKILLTGANGQVGWELQRTLACLGQVRACGREQLDLGNADSIVAIVRDTRPDIIVNAAAYTAVDKAETEPELALALNSKAPGILAAEAKKLGALLVHYSTDYVFDGAKTSAYSEDDPTNPLSVYGRSKLAGEQAIQAENPAHLILRTSWVYSARGRNFLLTMLRLAREKEELRVVADQIGAPTWCRMIAEASALILARHPINALRERSGVYHLSAAGEISWHGFAEAIFANARLIKMPRVIPISSAEYPLPARRPLNSLLSNHKLAATFNIQPPDILSSLRLCMHEFVAA